MTKSQIKAELRKEAFRLDPLFANLSDEAFEYAFYIKSHADVFESKDHKRMFFLVVAEAL